jgi:predicted ATPase
MAITNITVSNFKSFKHLDLNLGRFNVVIGANASGKSNFVEIFRFFKTLERESLDDAISLHGGPGSIVNKKLGPSEPLRMRTTSDRQMEWSGLASRLQVYETTYDFALQFESPQTGSLIKDDHFTQKLRVGMNDEDTELTLDISVSEGKPKVEFLPQTVLDRLKDSGSDLKYALFLGLSDYRRGLPEAIDTQTRTTLLINQRFLGFIERRNRLFGSVGVYDIDPHAVKRPHEKAGRLSLDANAENLSLVLKNILADPEKSRKFHNLLRYMLPFAAEAGVEEYLGTSLLLKLREEYYDGSLLANLLSDGTVDVVALITALFFEDKDVVIIEEPERNMHPHLISGLMELMKDASRNKQIIITTHSPEVVRHAGVENLLLISRDEEGFSAISRPADKQDVRVFLENNLGLDEVFVQELWGR